MELCFEQAPRGEGSVVLSRAIYKKQRGRRWLTGLAVSAVVAGTFLVGSTVLAVHDTGSFELDGNAVASTQHDWDQVCYQATGNALCGTSTPAGANAVSWTADTLKGGTDPFVNDSNATIFTGGGSKDGIDISSWAWKDGAGGLPDKDNLNHSFAARYNLTPDTDPSDGTLCPSGPAPSCDILFFGSDRFDNSGDAQQGFWFFQNAIGLGSTKSGGGFNFTGLHKNGDLLIISDFSNGGTTSTISVYQWNSAISGNLQLLGSSTSANCATAAAGDAFCGLVNPGPGLTTAPWPFTDKSGNHNYLNGEFYEGAVNLSTLGLADECFSTVASETRSSTSTTATLKDFVLGNFASCTASMTTTASTNAAVLPGVSVTDTATVVGSSSSNDPTGDVTFFLCSVAAGGDCASGGTNIGTGALVGNNAGTSTATSPAVNTAASPLDPGHYCFRAEWPGDLNYTTALSHTNSTTECFTVQPTSSTTTAQKWYPQDSATVVVNGAPVSGTVDFTLYPSNDCSGTPLGTFSDSSVPFTTNDQTSVSISTSQSVSWTAVFTPSDSNVQGSTSGCEVSDLTITN